MTARLDVVVVVGNVASEIVRVAEELPADMIVIGTHGRSGFDRLMLGSVTERILRRAPCPVLTVPRRHGPDRSVPAAIVHTHPVRDRFLRFVTQGAFLRQLHRRAGQCRSDRHPRARVECRRSNRSSSACPGRRSTDNSPRPSAESGSTNCSWDDRTESARPGKS